MCTKYDDIYVLPSFPLAGYDLRQTEDKPASQSTGDTSLHIQYTYILSTYTYLYLTARKILHNNFIKKEEEILNREKRISVEQ
jgi:hypothetical protein